MASQLQFATAGAATLAVLVAYLVIGIRGRATDRREYYIASQTVNADDYATSSIGYALQMAAVFLFTYWALLYGLGALWTALFWLLGYVVLYACLPWFMTFHSDPFRTLHQYVTQRHGGGRGLQRAAALATILGLGGAMMAEIDYTILAYAPLGLTPAMMPYVRFSFVAFGTIYIIISGFKAEIRTERWQLPIAYAGLFAGLIWVLPSVWAQANNISFLVLVGMMLFVVIGLAASKNLTSKERAFPILQTYVLVAVAIGIAMTVWWTASSLPSGSHSTVLNMPAWRQFRAQGVLGIFSLLLANALWMPIDLSTWQRIASVRSDSNRDLTLRRLRLGTKRILFESPVSWVLGACIGIAISGAGFLPAGADPGTGIGAFATHLANGDSPLWPKSTALVFYGAFLIGCISVMLSTVNGIVSAVTFTVEHDVFGHWQDSDRGSDAPTGLGRSRATAITVVAAIAVLYELLILTMGSHLSAFLYSVYAAQIALVPCVFLALWGRRLCSKAAIASVSFGLVGAAGSFILAVRVTDVALAADVAVLPPIFSLFAAVAGYLMFYRPGHNLEGHPQG